MVKAKMDIRLKAVILYGEGVYSGEEIAKMYNISTRTLRRWRSAYSSGGFDGLHPGKTGPKRASHAISKRLEKRILRLKECYPTWGARRIAHQFDLPVSWRTVHRVLRKHGLLVHVKAKPQPCRRFQRKHVDSLWQGDTFEFRIRGVGKVYVTGFTDDCSRYRVVSKAYLHKSRFEAVNALRWALRKGRKPSQIYLDNGKQFVSKAFKKEAEAHGIKLIYGRPYNAKGRGKIESYHKTLHRELICLKQFDSLSSFRRELWKFDRRFNDWRKMSSLGWQTPSSVYNDARYFRKENNTEQKRT
jgi:transposase InsO family protein